MAVVTAQLTSMFNGGVLFTVTYDDVTGLLTQLKLTNNAVGRTVTTYIDLAGSNWATLTAAPQGESIFLPLGLLQSIDDLARIAVVVG